MSDLIQKKADFVKKIGIEMIRLCDQIIPDKTQMQERAELLEELLRNLCLPLIETYSNRENPVCYFININTFVSNLLQIAEISFNKNQREKTND